MIGSTALSADASAGHSLDYLFVRNFNVDDKVDVHAHLIKRFRLRNGAGETVKDEAVLAVIRRETVLDDPDDYLVRDERAFFGVLPCSLAHFGLILDCFSDDRARGNSGDRVLFGNDLSLSAFAGAGCAKENHVH